jgi:ABC-type oligopeptide transport system substrate-binding subunit
MIHLAAALRPIMRALIGGALLGGLAWSVPAAAVEAPAITSHGISAFGDLKYPAGFTHFDYVNPDAPQGGIMSFRGTGASQTFDSLNAFILKGQAAQGLGLLYDSLLVGSADEADSSYGLSRGAAQGGPGPGPRKGRTRRRPPGPQGRARAPGIRGRARPSARRRSR